MAASTTTKKKRVRNKSTGRDYKKEYANYQGKPEQIKKRTQRNAAARKKKCPAGQDVDHKKPIRSGGSNKASNLVCKAKSANRSFSRKNGTNARKARRSK